MAYQSPRFSLPYFDFNAAVHTPKYAYSPLDPNVDSIWLVVIEPSSIGFFVKCHLRHVAFAEKPKYEAL
jgi:hypothetical protein